MCSTSKGKPVADIALPALGTPGEDDGANCAAAANNNDNVAIHSFVFTEETTATVVFCRAGDSLVTDLLTF